MVSKVFFFSQRYFRDSQPIHATDTHFTWSNKKIAPEALASFFISPYISDFTSTKLLPRKILNFYTNFCSAL